MKKIVIFGATGSLGVPIATHFYNLGYIVYAVGHIKGDNGYYKNLNIPFYKVDISNPKDFDKLPQTNIDVIIHFAGALPASMDGYNPTVYIDSIIKGTLNVLEYTRKCGAERIIFPQTLFDIYYLFGSRVPVDPDSLMKVPEGDHAVYVLAKMAAVNLIEHYHQLYGFKRFILRLPRIYLYHPNPYTYTDGIKVLVSDRLLIEKSIKGETIEVWGDPDRILETVCVWDFLQIVEKCMTVDIEGGIYNVGSGGSSLRQRIIDIIDVFSPKNHQSNIVYCPEKKNCTQFVLSIEKTIEELGYQPQYDWKSYLVRFKQEMENEPFAKIWGEKIDII